MSYKRHKLGQRPITQTACRCDWDYADHIKENPEFLNIHTIHIHRIGGKTLTEQVSVISKILLFCVHVSMKNACAMTYLFPSLVLNLNI